MAGFEVDIEIRKDDGQAMLSVRLQNQDDTDIFVRFCEDIVMTISNARDEISAGANHSFHGQQGRACLTDREFGIDI